jgi:hypothetical protein
MAAAAVRTRHAPRRLPDPVRRARADGSIVCEPLNSTRAEAKRPSRGRLDFVRLYRSVGSA